MAWFKSVSNIALFPPLYVFFTCVLEDVFLSLNKTLHMLKGRNQSFLYREIRHWWAKHDHRGGCKRRTQTRSDSEQNNFEDTTGHWWFYNRRFWLRLFRIELRVLSTCRVACDWLKWYRYTSKPYLQDRLDIYYHEFFSSRYNLPCCINTLLAFRISAVFENIRDPRAARWNRTHE